MADPVEEPEPIVLRAALRYAQRGLRVIPIHPGKKRPVGDNWQTRATTNPDTIRAWWTQNPGYGVGLVMGWYGDRCLFAIDVDNGVDPATGRIKQGSDSLRDLELEHGALPETVTSLSGGGGQHIILWSPVEITNDQAGRLGLDLDLRGVGGQIVVWPTIHPNGNSYEWELSPFDTKIARAPDAYIDILTRPLTEPKAERREHTGTPRPGDRFAAAVTWPELLTADGATYLGDRTDRASGHRYELWARPGADHTSATLYYRGSDVLKVFTPNWPGLTQDQTYTRFGYWTATRYAGNHTRAAATLAQIERDEFIATFATSLPPNPDPAPTSEHAASGSQSSLLINWPEFWGREHRADDWLVEPLIPRGRQIVLYAKAKAGKSLLTLDIAAALATGRPLLGRPAGPPITVLYLDYEMTEADLQERLEDLGYGPDDNLDNLKYALLPAIDPLDTAAGAQTIVQLVKETGAELVIIDTTARAVAGDENSADTIRAFYRHTGIALKALGVTLLRVDHAGKDLELGQRGSSAKVDDVDLVWYLQVTDDGVELKLTHQRVSWVPSRVLLTRQLEPNLAHLLAPRSWPAGTTETAKLLDRLSAPLGVSRRTAQQLLRANGEPRRSEVVAAALRWRREQASDPDVS